MKFSSAVVVSALAVSVAVVEGQRHVSYRRISPPFFARPRRRCCAVGLQPTKSSSSIEGRF
eukprot:scaffold852_cov197-Alexandrium_tamarense.AAC.43